MLLHDGKNVGKLGLGEKLLKNYPEQQDKETFGLSDVLCFNVSVFYVQKYNPKQCRKLFFRIATDR